MTALHAVAVAADIAITSQGREDVFLLNGQYVQCLETHGIGAHDPKPSVGSMALRGGIEVGSTAFFNWWMLRHTTETRSRWRYAVFSVNGLLASMHIRAAVNSRVCMR